MIKFRFHREAVIWFLALVYLAYFNPYHTGEHFSVCLLHLLGFDWCPGCGLGHSVSFLLHGDLSASWESHWLGLPALIILIHRIFILSFTFKKSLKISTS